VTGSEVREIRDLYKLEIAEFAELIGVGLSTIYRWEACKFSDVNIDPFQKRIMKVMKSQIEEQKNPDAMIKQIGACLARGGGLLGLHCLLKHVYKEILR